MSFLRAYHFVFAPVLLCACSSSSSPVAAIDAATSADATTDAQDASITTGDDAFESLDAPVPDAFHKNDAESACDELAQMVSDLETTARACDPSSPNQCNAQAQGPCCPISVDVASTEAVANLENAVMTYAMQCNPACSLCTGVVPSKHCVGSATQGTCE